MNFIPTEITLHQQSNTLEIAFNDSSRFTFPAEFLRVYSPSAEVRGHGPGQETLQTGKRNVKLIGVEPAGSYALKLEFDDGHDTGLYDWDMLYKYGRQQDEMWQDYLTKLETAGDSRDLSNKPTITESPKGCGA
jgi:DUF971 family protein